MHRVTIGLPVYNGARYIEECLASIQSQTFRDFRLVISDNASTDGTAEVCRRFASKDERIAYVRQPTNIGAARNYDFTFHQSSGEFFKWHAHDDFLSSTYLERCVAALDAAPAAVAAHTATRLIDADSRPLVYDPNRKAWFDSNGTKWVSRIDDPKKLLDSDPVERFRWIVNTYAQDFEIFGVFRRSSLAQSALHLPFWGSDKTLLAELTLHGPFAHVPEELFHRRCHGEQASSLSPREKVKWLDPRMRYLPFATEIMALSAYMRAIRKAPIGTRDRIRCYAIVGRRLFHGRKWNPNELGLVSSPNSSAHAHTRG